MKLHKLFIFAIMIFAAIAAQTSDAAAQKNASRNWMVFTGYQAVALERSPVAPRYSCESSGIYATANFAAPVDLADGFYVTIAADGELLIQQQMTVDNAPDAIRSIPVDLVPDDDADLGFPDASFGFSRKLLTALKPGVHKITVAVSIGESDEQISAGTFTFDNRRGCEERFARVDRLINGAVTGDAEVEQTEAEPADDEGDTPAVPARPQITRPEQQIDQTQRQTDVQPERREQQQQQQSEPAKPVEDPEVEINNNCGESRYIKIETPTKGSWNQNFHGSTEMPRLPLGTKIYVVIDGGEQLIDTVVANPSDTSYGRQRIKLCR